MWRSPPWLGLPLCTIWDHEYVHLVVRTSRFISHSWLITGFVTILTWRVPLFEQELFTLPGHHDLLFVLRVCFVDRCLSFFIYPLSCLLFDLRILVSPLVSSNFLDKMSIFFLLHIPWKCPCNNFFENPDDHLEYWTDINNDYIQGK